MSDNPYPKISPQQWANIAKKELEFALALLEKRRLKAENLKPKKGKNENTRN